MTRAAGRPRNPDLDRAIELAARIPDARVGKVEVRPIMDFPTEMD